MCEMDGEVRSYLDQGDFLAGDGMDSRWPGGERNRNLQPEKKSIKMMMMMMRLYANLQLF